MAYTINTVDFDGLTNDADVLLVAGVLSDTFANSGKNFAVIKNADASPITLTQVSTANNPQEGTVATDKVWTIAATTGQQIIRLGNVSGFRATSTLEISAIASVTIGIFQLDV